METSHKKSQAKKIIWALVALALVGACIAWYLFTLKHDDTASIKADYTVSAYPFIDEFRKDAAAANKKYSEKIITVNGRVAEIEKADTTLNIKMSDTATGDYIIFAFQQQDMEKVKTVKEGDSVSIKGSCSSGVFSKVLELTYVAFKRCTIN
jgi:hypothetical protein